MQLEFSVPLSAGSCLQITGDMQLSDRRARVNFFSLKMNDRRKGRTVLEICSAVCAVAALGMFAQRAFISPPSEGSEFASTHDQVSRSRAFRLLPALALGLQTLPSYGDTGITEAWKVRPNGDEDTIHTGGVKWTDIKVGTGPIPEIGENVGIDFQAKALWREREIIFDDTKGKVRDYRFGVGQMLPGMDEGIKGMRTGGIRKLEIPGNLAFGPVATPQAPGRPPLPPFTPFEVTVKLLFIPGRDDVDPLDD